MATHSYDCWRVGPAHYECALREIERLERVVRQLEDRLTDLPEEP